MKLPDEVRELVDEYERLIVEDKITWHEPEERSTQAMTTQAILGPEFGERMFFWVGKPVLAKDSFVVKLDDSFLRYIIVLDGIEKWVFCTDADPSDGELDSMRPSDALAYLYAKYLGFDFQQLKMYFIGFDRKIRQKPDEAHPFEDWGSAVVRDEDGNIVGLTGYK